MMTFDDNGTRKVILYVSCESDDFRIEWHTTNPLGMYYYIYQSFLHNKRLDFFHRNVLRVDYLYITTRV